MDTNTEFNIIEQLSKMFVKLITICVFGFDLSDKLIDFEENGEKTQIKFGVALGKMNS